MATVIMGIPPEGTEAFKTDIDYRLGVEEAMNNALGGEDVDEVILTYSADNDDESPDEDDFDFAMNPGVSDFLKNKGVDDDVIEYILTFEDTRVQGKLANEIRKTLQSEDRLLGLREVRRIGEPLRPKELSPLELALYGVVRGKKNLTNWLGREIRLMKKEYGPEMDRVDIVQFLYPLQSIKDWYVANHRPSMINLSFAEARDKAVEWEKEMAGSGSGLYYRPVNPGNILFLDPKTGFSIQNIDNENDLAVEGNKMHNCVASYWANVEAENTKILSLRDPSNKPHATIELNKLRGEGGEGEWSVGQIKSPGNKVPIPEHREIIARYFITIPGVRYTLKNRNYIKTRGFRSLAIESAVGFDRWDYDDKTTEHGRPDDLTDNEIASIIVEHAKNITAVLLHAKRFNWRLKKGDKELRFLDRTVGLDIKNKRFDEYGIAMVAERREETNLNASIFGGDLRVFLGDAWLNKHRDRPLSPVLRDAIDILVDAVVDADTIEKKLHNQWDEGVSRYLEKRRATLNELKKIGPDNLTSANFGEGLLKEFYKEQRRSRDMPHPSYANQKFLLEKNIARAESALGDRRYWQPISVKIANIAPFSYDSFSECAQKMIVDPSSKDGNPPGRWRRDNSFKYFAITVFKKINGCSLFVEDAR